MKSQIIIGSRRKSNEIKEIEGNQRSKEIEGIQRKSPEIEGYLRNQKKSEETTGNQRKSQKSNEIKRN